MFPDKQFVVEGGLIAYGPSVSASYRRAAAYVDKILRGARAAAKALGLTVPPGLLVAADEVIE
jgi:ABC-type uncharacterized transport system substrate-binding protein